MHIFVIFGKVKGFEKNNIEKIYIKKDMHLS